MALSLSLAARALLAVALMVGYYVLAIGISAALLWLPYAEYVYLHHVTFKLALLFWGIALTILWALVPRRDRFEPPGPELTPDAAPQLFAMIDNVAAATSQQRPSEVYLLNDVNAWVSQRGGFMGFGSRRIMGIGFPLMTSLTRPELRAVLAHEFGHYCSGDVGIGPWIYKTRAAIGRTLIGIEETLFHAVFNWYAKVFMRMTMAVSRHQEFVADEAAARVTGAPPMVSALRKVAMLGPAYATYLHHEVVPVLNSGFLPPLAEGFQRFMHSPDTGRALERMAQQHTTGSDAGKFDTHPPLKERVAALERLQPVPITWNIDDSSPIVNDFEQMARDLFEYSAGGSFRKLRAIEWNDVGASVYAELWSRAATARAEWFGTLTIDQLPSGKRAYEDMGKALKGKMDISPSEERIEHAAQMMTVGVGAALLRAGWRFETSPGSPLAATNGPARISPREVVERLVENADAYKEWRKTCDALGITGLPLRPSPEATAAITT